MKLNKTVLLVLVTLAVAVCGGDNNTSKITAAEAIQVADKSGVYPQLNRDTSIAGPDSNNNGVRDDIDAYIDSLPDTNEQKAALRQASASITHTMIIDPSDQNALANALKQIANAVSCLNARYKTSTIAGLKSSTMEKLTVNTKERFMAYENFNSAASGHTFRLPSGDGCSN